MANRHTKPTEENSDIQKEIATRIDNLANVVSLSTKAGIPVPCLSSTLDYLNSYRTNRLPQNLVQAMRDCFGSHTYERIDKEGSFHTEWMKWLKRLKMDIHLAFTKTS